MAVEKPIIQIPVDDADFKRFADAFSNFRKEVEDMPGAWREINAQWQKMGGNSRQMQSAIVATGGDLNKISKTMGDIADAQGRLAKGAKGASNSFAGMFSSLSKSQGVLSRMAGGMKGLAAFAGLGLAAGGAVLGAADLLGNFAMSTGRSSRGAGLSPGAYQAFTTSMQPFFGGNNVLEGATSAKYDATQWGWLSTLGISPQQAQGLDPAHLAILEAQAVRRAFKQNSNIGTNAQLGAAVQLGWGQSDILNIGNASNSALSGAEKGALTPLPGFSQKSEQAFDDFVVKLDQAGDKIKDVFVTGFTPLVPKLTEVVNQFSGFVAAFVSNPNFVNDVQKFADGSVLIAQEVWAVAQKLKWILPATPGTPSPAQAQVNAQIKHAMPAILREIYDPYHNPGNIMDVGPSGAISLHQFSSDKAGIQGLQSLLTRKYNHMSIRDLVNQYAPASAGNDVNSYIKDLAKWTGLNPDKSLDLNNPSVMSAVVRGIVRQEGDSSLSASQINSYLGIKSSDPVTVSAKNKAFVEKEQQFTTMPRSAAPTVHVYVHNSTASKVTVQANAAASS